MQSRTYLAGEENMQKLDDFRVGNYALVIDMLGTAVRMADRGQWLASLEEMLVAVRDVFNDTTDIGQPERSQPVYQYGDTFVFPSDEPSRLVPLGSRLIARWWQSDVLVQAAIAGGGVYYVPELPSLAGKPIPHTFKPQLLVGPAVARGHLAMRGLKGPRFVVDAETSTPPPSAWRYYSGKHAFANDPATHIVVKEVAWWDVLVNDLEAQVQERVAGVEQAITVATSEMKGSPVLPLWQRDVDSLKRRREHLLAFLNCVSDEAP